MRNRLDLSHLGLRIHVVLHGWWYIPIIVQVLRKQVFLRHDREELLNVGPFLVFRCSNRKFVLPLGEKFSFLNQVLYVRVREAAQIHSQSLHIGVLLWALLIVADHVKEQW